MINTERMEARDRLINQIADEFEASGIEYTCGQVVMQFACKRIVPLTENMPSEWLVHHTFKMNRLERYVWQEVHNRWKVKHYVA